jgi:carbon monoxide dehydrogenase subunit G
MEVKLDKKYPIAATVEQAWTVLADVNATAVCMPGAQITEQVDATHYKGAVKSKVGPATMSFAGTIEVLELEPSTRTLRMLGAGADKAGSSASMDLTARVVAAEGGGSTLEGEAVIKVNGKLAQFGSRLLVPVADAMLAQFADRFRAAAAMVPVAAEAGAAAGAVADGDTGAPAGGAGTSAPASDTGDSEAAAAASGATAAASAPRAAPPAPPAPVATELNALGLIWTVIKGWFAGLFGGKRT